MKELKRSNLILQLHYKEYYVTTPLTKKEHGLGDLQYFNSNDYYKWQYPKF